MTQPIPNFEEELINILEELDKEILNKLSKEIEQQINKKMESSIQPIRERIDALNNRIKTLEATISQLDDTLNEQITSIKNDVSNLKINSSSKNATLKSGSNSTKPQSIELTFSYKKFTEELKRRIDENNHSISEYDAICAKFKSKYPDDDNLTKKSYHKLVVLLYLILHDALSGKALTESVQKFTDQLPYAYISESSFVNLISEVEKEFGALINEHRKKT
jgi:hypothetical protein